MPAPGAGPATSEAPTDFRALFESVPGSHLVLAADPPHFTMLAASDERLAATLTTRAATLGRPLFEVFPDANPENPEPSGVANLRASLETVLRTRAPHRMAVQRYDLRGPDGIWEVRYWAPRNVPVLGPDGRIRYLIHHVEDVTDLVLQREATAAATLAHARSVRLQRLTAALAAARTLDDVAAVVVADMVTALGARTGALAGRSPDGRGLVLLRTVGFPEPVEAGARRQTLDSGSPLVECVRTASPVWVERRDGPAGLDARYPPIAPTWDAVGVGSAAFLPLVAGGEAVGAISFAFEGPRAFDPLERAFLLAVSQQAALAVERARLVDAERAARDEVERLLAESETGNAQLRDQALELELANHQLQEQATELEMQAETLRSTVALLGARTAEAEAARADAEAQRARAAGILETMADAHFVLDAEFRFVSANPTMARLVGRSRDALLGRTIWEAFPGTVGTVFEASYRRVAAERVAVHFTGAYDAGGLALVPEVEAYPTPDGGVAVFWRDVRARVEAERERERLLDAERAARADADAARARAEAVLAGIADAFYLLDREWRFTYVNAAAEPLLQTTGAALLGRTLWEAFPDVAGSVFEGPYRETMATGRPTGVEAYFAPLGTWFDVRTYAWAGGVMVYFRDVGARKAAEEERERLLAATEAARAEAEGARGAAVAASRAKGEFLAVMSHELRTPLNAIAGYVELVELGIHGPVTDEQRTALARVQRAQRHLLGLINGVLNYARVEAGAVHYAVEDVALDEVIASCEMLIAPQVRARGLTLRQAADTQAGGPPPRARADREKVEQILLNLLSNAVKFTPAGGGGTLDCGFARDGGRVRVWVRDTGRGIAPHELVRIFEPFVQLDAALTRTQEGTGLGLAISRDLARGMGGDLTVESAPGAGSTFTLTLPAA